MGCGMGVIKYLLFIFNFIFVLGGLAILILGIVVQLGNSNYGRGIKEEASGDLTFIAVTLIIIGSIIFVIAFFGCCGAIRESHCMIITFASLLLTLLIIQVAVAIFAFVALGKADDLNLKEEYAKDVFSKYEDRNDSMEIVNLIQKELECCGVDSYQDFQKKFHKNAPGSCCDKNDNVTCDPFSTNVKDRPGCGEILEDLFESACAILGGISLGTAAIELIGIIFALCLANSIKNDERRGYGV